MPKRPLLITECLVRPENISDKLALKEPMAFDSIDFSSRKYCTEAMSSSFTLVFCFQSIIQQLATDILG